MRFDEDALFTFDRIDSSATVTIPNGDVRFAWFPWHEDRATVDTQAAADIAWVCTDRRDDTSQTHLGLA